jgi:hypothetical protein
MKPKSLQLTKSYSRSDSIKQEIDSQGLSENELKKEIKSRFSKDQTWRYCSLQLSIQYSEDEPSLLRKMFAIQNQVLLLLIHDLIFKKGNNYLTVFTSVREVLTDLNILEDFEGWAKDPTMMVALCLKEGSNFNEQHSSLDSLVKAI